jgi:hypothetical protein
VADEPDLVSRETGDEVGKEERYQCDSEEELHSSKTALTEPLLKCSKCIYTFHLKSVLTVHVSLVHLCELCDFVTKSKANLSKHVKITHLGIKYANCQYCDYMTDNICHFQRHIKNVHWK